MFPLFPFVAGLAAGAVALNLYKNQKTPGGLKVFKTRLKDTSAQARETLRHAAVSGLSTLESSSVRLRDRLQASSETPAADEKMPAAATKKTAARKTAPKARKTVAKKSAP